MLDGQKADGKELSKVGSMELLKAVEKVVMSDSQKAGEKVDLKAVMLDD